MSSPTAGRSLAEKTQEHSWAHFPVMAWQASMTKVGLLAPLGLALVAAIKPKEGQEVGRKGKE